MKGETAREISFAASACSGSEPASRVQRIPYAWLCCLALVALIFRWLPLLLEPGLGWTAANNSEAYLDLMEGYRHGCGFAAWTATGCAAPETSRTPGYPLLLAALPSVRSAVAMQAVLWSALCLAVGIFASRRWGAGAGIIACLLLALDVSSFVYSNKIMTEVPFTFLLTAAVMAELRALEAARSDRGAGALMLLAGLLFACAIAVRPIAQMVVPLAALFAIFVWRGNWGWRLGMGLLLVALPVVLVAGWRYRNRTQAGIDTFSTVGAFNLYNFRAAGTIAYATGQSLQTVWRSWDKVPVESYSRRALAIIRRHPFAFAYMTGWSFVYVALVPDRWPLARVLSLEKQPKVQDPGSLRIDGAVEGVVNSPLRTLASIYRDELDSSPLFTALIIAQLAMTVVVWSGAACAVISELRRYPAWDARLLFMVAAALWLLLLAAGPEGTDRFRIPALPFLAIVSGLGWCRVWGRYFAHPANLSLRRKAA